MACGDQQGCGSDLDFLCRVGKHGGPHAVRYVFASVIDQRVLGRAPEAENCAYGCGTGIR